MPDSNTEKPQDSAEEQVGFWGGWTGLYVFILISGVLQLALLYLFTLIFNNP